MLKELSLTVVLLAAGACTQVQNKVANKTLIEVNGEAVTAQVFAQRLALRLRNRDPLTVKDPSRFETEKQSLADEFITELICKQWATKNGVQLGDAEVEQALKITREQYTNEVAFRQTLAEENLDVDGWREITKSTLYRKAVFDKVTESVTGPTETELKVLFEQDRSRKTRPARIKVRQIVVDKEDVAQRLFSEVQSGQSLGRLAREYSMTAEAEQDGLTDWIEKGVLPVFDDAFKWPIGGKPKLIKSPYGWHIMEVVAREPERKVRLEDLKNDLFRAEIEKRKNRKFTQWLDSELRSSSILRHETALKSVSISTRDD